MLSETQLKTLSKEAAVQLDMVEAGVIHLNELKALLAKVKTIHEGGIKTRKPKSQKIKWTIDFDRQYKKKKPK
jgi:hypothetical protein